MDKEHASARLEALHSHLRTAAGQIETDPETNSVFSLGRSVFAGLETGSEDLGQIEDLIDEIHLRLADARIGFLRDQHFDCKPNTAWQAVGARLEALASEGWPSFKAAVERENGGIVFTAHPTFALSRDARMAIAAQAESPKKTNQKALAKSLAEDSRDWSASITLGGEHEEIEGVV
ncbi:MAG: hypothetical protein AAFX86_14805 [Pseudomonadota bacterium]